MYGINLIPNNIILNLAFATMTKSKLRYQDRIASQVLAAFRYAMLSKLIFAQYSI
ncbi:putative ATPase with chaperone activity [Pedobacter cryoconitis]|uniref:Putative ATPase with chaperone activity n=1 Tax=Pedobacter cryoconitis TaxID=188932 RepID=A0A7X0MHX1_9SPHI|nr:putative ATPase with chaperone activity [Pedobacter cryoconitis]